MVFQSTHPRGVRLYLVILFVSLCLFQSTHPRGVRRKFITGKLGSRNFNPRTHVGCDIKWIDKFHLIFISIHAPTWGATSFAENKHIRVIFQSTHPRGVRLTECNFINPYIGISIHAPTWGATYVPQARRGEAEHFNPRTHVGCDRSDCISLSCWLNFNPRTHVGCDQRQYIFTAKAEISIHAPTWGATVKPSNGWLLGHKDNEFANENIIIINSVNIT